MEEAMKHLAIALALGLAACVPETPTIPPPPAPLAKTVIDDQALIAADKGFDLFNDAINMAIDRKIITPGSPTARSLAYWIRKVDTALQAAFHAAEVGHAGNYQTALAEAQLGIAELKKLVKGN
jgi:hypothetical protein